MTVPMFGDAPLELQAHSARMFAIALRNLYTVFSHEQSRVAEHQETPQGDTDRFE